MCASDWRARNIVRVRPTDTLSTWLVNSRRPIAGCRLPTAGRQTSTLPHIHSLVYFFPITVPHTYVRIHSARYVVCSYEVAHYASVWRRFIYPCRHVSLKSLRQDAARRPTFSKSLYSTFETASVRIYLTSFHLRTHCTLSPCLDLLTRHSLSLPITRTKSKFTLQ